MTTSNSPSTYLLFLSATDSVAQRAIRFCHKLANATSASVSVIDVLKPIPERWRSLLHISHVKTIANDRLAQREAQIRELLNEEQVSWPVVVRQGVAAVEIARQLANSKSELLIKPQDGTQVIGFDAADRQLVRKCPSAVMLLKSDHAIKLSKLLATIDPIPGTDPQEAMNLTVLVESQRLKRKLLAKLSVVGVWSPFSELFLSRTNIDELDLDLKALKRSEELAHREYMKKLLGSAHVDSDNLEMDILHGDPAHKVPSHASHIEADLLVLGTIGQSRIKGLMIGNTVESILDHAPCSVLAIKPKSFKSPFEL